VLCGVVRVAVSFFVKKSTFRKVHFVRICYFCVNEECAHCAPKREEIKQK
jgi:hypothetical protein